MYNVRLYANAKSINSRTALCVALLNWNDTWITICDTLAARTRSQALTLFIADCIATLKAPSIIEITVPEEIIDRSMAARRINDGDVEAFTEFGKAIEAGQHQLARDITDDPDHLLIQACGAAADATSFITPEHALNALQQSAPMLVKIEEMMADAGLWPWTVQLLRMRHSFTIIDGKIERFVGNPRSDGMRNLVTTEQLTRMRRLARSIPGMTQNGLDTTCYDELGCNTHDLNQFSAEWFIQYLTLEAQAHTEGRARGTYKRERVMPEQSLAETNVASPRGFRVERDQNGQVIFPDNPLATTMHDLISPKQLGMIRALSRELDLQPDETCLVVMNCKTDELSKYAAAAFIEDLLDLKKRATGYDAKTADLAPRGTKDVLEMVTPKQKGLLRALARETGVNLEDECLSLHQCNTDQLTKRGASSFISHLQALQANAQQSGASA